LAEKAFVFLPIFKKLKTNQVKNKIENPQETQMEVELSEDMAEGVYANLAMIAHSHSEFVLDFIRMMPGVPKAKVKARVVITPEHAQRLLQALKDNIRKYEEAYGKVTAMEDQNFHFPMNFKGTVGEA
jgi:Protein of unknown function (DUF3467)